jgi:hypothetical protein
MQKNYKYDTLKGIVNYAFTLQIFLFTFLLKKKILHTQKF